MQLLTLKDVIYFKFIEHISGVLQFFFEDLKSVGGYW